MTCANLVYYHADRYPHTTDTGFTPPLQQDYELFGQSVPYSFWKYNINPISDATASSIELTAKTVALYGDFFWLIAKKCKT